MSTTPTLADLSTQLNNLQARVNAIDGQSLADPTTSQLAQLQAQVRGLRRTLNQTVLTLNGQLSDLTESIENLQTGVNQLLGVSPPPAA